MHQGWLICRGMPQLLSLDLCRLSCLSDAVLDQLHGMQLKELILSDAACLVANVTVCYSSGGGVSVTDAASNHLRERAHLYTGGAPAQRSAQLPRRQPRCAGVRRAEEVAAAAAFSVSAATGLQVGARHNRGHWL